MRASFFPIMFVVTIVASRTNFGAAETNPSGRVHAKNDDTIDHLKTADAQVNSTNIEKDERLFWWSLRRKNTPTASEDEPLLKKKAVMNPDETSTKFTKEKVTALATSEDAKGDSMYLAMNALSVMVVVIMLTAAFYGFRFYTN